MKMMLVQVVLVVLGLAGVESQNRRPTISFITQPEIKDVFDGKGSRLFSRTNTSLDRATALGCNRIPQLISKATLMGNAAGQPSNRPSGGKTWTSVGHKMR